MASSHDDKPKSFPAQQQSHPGAEHKMDPEPQYSAPWYKGSNKLQDKVAIITGGDSGIGRSVSILFAREGADVAICYFSNDKDAELTKQLVEKEGRKCLLLKGDVGDKHSCNSWVEQTMKQFSHIDILVNNAAVQHYTPDILAVKEEQLIHTFRVNMFGYFFMSQAVLPHLKKDGCIINTHSVVALKGNEMLIDYAATKGGIASFTTSLALQLAPKGIRVNAVAPGPIWTPFIPSAGFPDEVVQKFGSDTPLGRAGQPEEVAPAYVYLASRDASYVTGQTINVNGGTIVGQ